MNEESASPQPHALIRPTLWIQGIGWGSVLLLFALLVVLPLYQGRFYGIGQILFYCFLLVLSAWWLHWTHKEISVEEDGIWVRSPVHSRRIALDGLRVEVRTGWWSRVVILPAFGLPVSLLRPFWTPEPEATLSRLLPPGVLRMDPSPGIEDPGPEEF